MINCQMIKINKNDGYDAMEGGVTISFCWGGLSCWGGLRFGGGGLDPAAHHVLYDC